MPKDAQNPTPEELDAPFVVDAEELDDLDGILEVGTRFNTDRFDFVYATYEITDVSDDGAVGLQFVCWPPDPQYD